MQSLQMKEGKLLVRYFGVPLRTQKLTGNDCSVLIGKISNKIDSWVAKKLSFAGSLQLISAVLYSIQSFWFGIFILPKKIVQILEQKLNSCGDMWDALRVKKPTVVW